LSHAQAAAYSCVHNVLRAHAAAVQRFRALVPAGKISINLNCDFGTPYSSSQADQVMHRSMQACMHPSNLASMLHLAQQCWQSP
jgi:beta-glucosidase/6-phospho-beta-glucosidase/beta-galactosidase